MSYAVTNGHYIKEKLLQSEWFGGSIYFEGCGWHILKYIIKAITNFGYVTMFRSQSNHKLSKIAAFSFLNIAYFRRNVIREGIGYKFYKNIPVFY